MGGSVGGVFEWGKVGICMEIVGDVEIGGDGDEGRV